MNINNFGKNLNEDVEDKVERWKTTDNYFDTILYYKQFDMDICWSPYFFLWRIQLVSYIVILLI